MKPRTLTIPDMLLRAAIAAALWAATFAVYVA